MAHVFVGRESEARQLEALLAGARDRVPATVMLHGAAGIGKTRLLNEFVEKARAAGAFVLVGGCVPLGDGAIPYGPLTDALRLLVRRHGPRQAQELAGPAWSELAGLIVNFTDGVAPPTGMPGSQIRVFGAVSRLLDHIGATSPVVLVFEDIQWADPSTVDLIAYLTRTKTDQRMMLVCSYRSGLPPDHPLRALLAEPEFSRRTCPIHLGRFVGAGLRQLVTTLVTGTVGPERIERYIELSEGNPYFVEQLVTTDDPTRPALRVPESLHEIMLVRLDRLSETAVRVVRAAAVAGRRVSDRLLAAVIPDEAVLDAALRECLDHRILLVDDQVDDGYAFEHALLRETAYDTVSPRERRRLHAAMAEALSRDVDEQPRLLPEIAHHWFAADRRPEALVSAVHAGTLAVHMHAFREAEVQYRRALELWPRLPDAEAVAGVTREHLLRMAADTARWAGHVDSAVRWARQAVAEADPATDPSRTGELHERLGSYLWEAGRFAESVEAYHHAHELLTDRSPSAARARTRSALATAAVRDGRHKEALDLAERAVEEARSVGVRPEEGRALNSAGLALTMLGEPDAGEAALRESLRIAAEVDHIEDLLRAYGNLGVCLEHAGRMTDAVQAMLEGRDKARSLGVLRTRQAGVLDNNAGVALFRLGRWDEAADVLDEVLLYHPLSETLYPRLTRAELEVARGRFDAADRLLDGVRTQPNADPRFIASLYHCLAELAIWRADPAAARKAVTHGIEVVARTEDTRALLQLCAIGLRIAADGASPRAGSPEEEDPGDLSTRDWSAALITSARAAGDKHAEDSESAVLTRTCVAEERRLHGGDTATLWREVAAAWSGLVQPYPRAYALMRESEAAAEAGDKPTAAEAPAPPTRSRRSSARNRCASRSRDW
jgi:tetratricopeptide (TPR) repeat protein